MTTTSDTTSEIEEVLTRLVRVVRRADKFVLGFVKCNSPVQQQQLSRTLRERLSDKRAVEITLDEPIISLLDELTQVIDVNDPPAFVNVFGLEKSIYAQQDYSPVLGRLNNDRDLIRRACPAVLLIWLPDYALDKVVISAPDFWAWRSGVYEFPTESEHFLNDSGFHLNEDWTSLLSLSREEKQQEIERIEELIQTSQRLPNPQNREKVITARLLYQSGLLYNSLGNWQQAKERLEESQRLAEELGSQGGLTNTTLSLANMATNQGNLEEAQRLYESVKLREELRDNRQGVATVQYQLAKVMLRKGDILSAQHLFKQSLAYFEQSGDKVGLAHSLNGLASIHSELGEITESLNLYQRALSVAEEIGNKSLHGLIMHNIGLIACQQGNWEEAIRIFQKRLEDGRELGDKNAVAMSLVQLGMIRMTQGSYKEAFDYLTNAFLLFKQLQSPANQMVAEALQNLNEQVGDVQFEEWMKHSKSVKS